MASKSPNFNDAVIGNQKLLLLLLLLVLREVLQELRSEITKAGPIIL
jgi:hypothetical protein